MVRSTPASLVGSGYGVSFSERYSVRSAPPILSRRQHGTVKMLAGGSPGIDVEESSASRCPAVPAHFGPWRLCKPLRALRHPDLQATLGDQAHVQVCKSLWAL
jgi:hypothetical protein